MNGLALLALGICSAFFLKFLVDFFLTAHGYINMAEFIAACLTFEGEKQTFDISDEPVWILGKKYDTRTELSEAHSDVLSRMWLTYRRHFPALADDLGTTSDRGWGCMLRCGQMLLAEAVCRKQLGRSWRWSPECRDPTYLKLVAMFEDQCLAAFSLHVMTAVGKTKGKSVGEWYGPNTVAHLIKRLPEFDVWNNFAISVAHDNVLIVDEARALSKQSHPNGWDPLLILIPQRLGMEYFNPVYTEPLQKFFRMPQCLGILGGTPSHALFLIGCVGDCVIYLDPHTTQDWATVGSKETETQVAADLSYHCTSTPRMPFTKLDPSLALCFLCTCESELEDLCSTLRSGLMEGKGSPLLEVMETRPDYMKESAPTAPGYGYSAAYDDVTVNDVHSSYDDVTVNDVFSSYDDVTVNDVPVFVDSPSGVLRSRNSSGGGGGGGGSAVVSCASRHYSSSGTVSVGVKSEASARLTNKSRYEEGLYNDDYDKEIDNEEEEEEEEEEFELL